jgi:hypothetical protein
MLCISWIKKRSKTWKLHLLQPLKGKGQLKSLFLNLISFLLALIAQLIIHLMLITFI